ncbi:hypothetical protein PFLA_b0872 [Pseudoalteromonas flavipulchra NCIMB 2033 = ATCC BAA-314]|nr:hypothetical protein [Pseudoalteromonas flavipulchra NCIMB 2033 = ATCC BAA-314]
MSVSDEHSLYKVVVKKDKVDYEILHGGNFFITYLRGTKRISRKR